MDIETSKRICKENETCKQRRTGDRERENQRLRASATFRSISGFALPSLRHNNQTSPIGGPAGIGNMG